MLHAVDKIGECSIQNLKNIKKDEKIYMGKFKKKI